MKNKLRVAVIFGGRSGEHEVSLVSAASVMKAMDPSKYEIVPVGITKEGRFVGGQSVLEALKNGKIDDLPGVSFNLDTKRRGIFTGEKCEFQPIDLVFPVLHGPYGEDGTIQGLFEMAGLPYVGCGVYASAACMDKYASKIIFEMAGLPQAKYLHFTRAEIENESEKIKEMVVDEIGFPCFVKPSNMGSSVGISKVKEADKLIDALKFAAEFDSSILVEQGINAREIECAILGNDDAKASIAGEIVPSGEFYDYNAKYVDGASKPFIPAEISAEKMAEAREFAVKAYKAMQCSGLSRVDFLMDKKTEKLYLNEINTLPGFTSISMYPKLWEATGIPYPKLIDRLIELGQERFKEKSRNKTTFDSGSDWFKK